MGRPKSKIAKEKTISDVRAGNVFEAFGYAHKGSLIRLDETSQATTAVRGKKIYNAASVKRGLFHLSPSDKIIYSEKRSMRLISRYELNHQIKLKPTTFGEIELGRTFVLKEDESNICINPMIRIKQAKCGNAVSLSTGKLFTLSKDQQVVQLCLPQKLVKEGVLEIDGEKDN